MRRTGNIIVAVILGFVWLYFFYRFPHIGTIAKILALIVLIPPTAKVVYSFLLESRQKNDAAKSDELARNFTPFSGSAPTPNTENAYFCPECGAKNEIKGKFCCGCGKPLN